MSAIPKKDNYGRPTSEYIGKLVEMSDRDLVEAVSHACYWSAWAANNPRADYHWQCDATYAECQRREKPWLYQQGWNDSYRKAGYSPSESELAAAQPPTISEAGEPV